MKTVTEQTAQNWIDLIVKERGVKQARQLLAYNVTKNQHFNQSNQWITAAWQRLNEMQPS